MRSAVRSDAGHDVPVAGVVLPSPKHVAKATAKMPATRRVGCIV